MVDVCLTIDETAAYPAACSCEIAYMNDAFDAVGATASDHDFSHAPSSPAADAPMAEYSEPAEVLVDDAASVNAHAVQEPNGFQKMGLAPELLQAVRDLGFTQPTVVQEKCIPMAMQDLSDAAKGARFTDLMVSSQTGSGKTAAFLLPVLHTLLAQRAQAQDHERADFDKACADAAARGDAPPKRPRRKDPTSSRNFKAATPGALVLCPTRELAQQVAQDAIELVRHCRGLRVANVVGGMPYQMQIARLQNADLVVATPGRLLDLQRSMQIKLEQVQFLVVDEADRMLDLGFADDLAEINQLTIERKQTMMFSATLAPRIQQLATRVMREPQRMQIDSPQEKHQNIKQVLFWADNAFHKRKLLDHWLRDTTINQAIVFASTQIECDGLANDLQQAGFSAVALHGALNQGIRNRRLMALREGHVQILVATDVAARGLDVPTVTHVFNFGLPMKAEDYTHRIGRTGRAGRDGLAVTMAEFRDRRKIFDIEAYTRQPFKAETIPGLEPQQRMPESARARSNCGGRDSRGGFNAPSRDRKFGVPPRGRDGGGLPPHNDFARRSESAPRGEYAPRNDSAPRSDYAPRNDFAPRKPGFGKPAPQRPAFSPSGSNAGGAGFGPRDGARRPARPARPVRG